MPDIGQAKTPLEVLAGLRAARRLPPPSVARAMREAADITQAELAQALNVHRLTVQRWETGACKPRGDAALRYARLLAELQEVS